MKLAAPESADEKQPRGNVMNNPISTAPKIAGLSLGLMLFGAGVGCVNQIDRVTDCQDICSRYSDSFDSTYDVSACRSRCTEDAENSDDFDQRVDQCENCLDDRSCTSSAFSCSAECVTIVP
jgi:hypothetical protein